MKSTCRAIAREVRAILETAGRRPRPLSATLALAVLAGLVTTVALTGAGALASHRPAYTDRMDLKRKGTHEPLFAPALQNGAHEDTELRSASSRTYRNPDGTMVARAFARPVNFRAGKAWRSIDNTLVPASGGWRNRANNYSAFLPTDAGSAFGVNAGSSALGFALDGAHGTGTVKGDTQKIDNALPDVGLITRAESTGLEQTLSLASAKAQNQFTYRLSVSGGLRPRTNADGAIDFVDSHGQPKLALNAPAMRDSAGVWSSALKMKLEHQGGDYAAVLTIDRGWLGDPARKYPVMVDPAVIHMENKGDTRWRESGADLDCQITSGSGANTNNCTGDTLNLGWDGSNNNRTLLRFDLQTMIPSNTNVLRAEFGLHQYGASANGTISAEVHQMTRAWTSAVTWNKYDGTNSWTTAGGDFASSAAATASIPWPTGDPWPTFYPTSLVKGWINGSIANNGLVVKETTESSTNDVLHFDSSESIRDDYNDLPYVDVIYAPMTGQPGYYKYESQRLDDRMGLGVNVASGNLMVANNDLNIAGVAGLNETVGRYWNSQWERDNQDVGTGWTLGLGADVKLRILADDTAVFDGPGGYEVPFTAPVAPSKTYKSPAGVDATLCQYDATSCPGDTGGGSSPAYVLTFNHSAHRYTFSSTGQLISEQDRNHNPIRYTYDASGHLTQIKDTENRTTTVAQTGGLISSITDWSGRHVNYGYTNGDLTSYTDANGKTTSYSYDSGDDITQITDPNGNITKIAYDGDPNDKVTSITRVTDTVHGTGPTWSFSYQSASSPCTSGSDYGKTVVTDPNSHTTTYCVDSNGKVTSAQDANGNKESATYDSNYNITRDTPPMGSTHASDFTFDTTSDSNGNATNNPLTAQLASSDGTKPRSQSQLTYNSSQKFLPNQSIGADGQTTTYTYDGIGNLTDTSTAMGGTNVDGVHVDYNTNGTVKDSKDGNGNQTNYSYDSSNLANLTEVLEPTGSCVTSTRKLCWDFGYDGLSRPTSMTDGKNNQTTYTYDPLDRLTKITYSDGSTINYTYDSNGNLTQRVDNTGTTTYSYDALNRRTQEVYPGTNGVTNTYTYDGAGNLLTLHDTGGTVTYGYDAGNRLTSVMEPGGSCSGTVSRCTKFVYNGDNKRTETDLAGGKFECATYDNADRLKEIYAQPAGSGSNCTPATSGKLTDFTYTYLDTSQTPNKDANVFMTRTDLAGNSTSYTYDNVGRLATANTNKAGGGTDNYSYNYDKSGNMLSQTHNSSVTSFGYNAANQLCWKLAGSSSNLCGSTPTGAITYTFDANGNQTGSSDGRTFSYNLRNQQTDYTPVGSWDHQATYAGADQRETTMYDNIAFTYNTMGLGRRINTNVGWVDDYTREPDGRIIGEHGETAGDHEYYLHDGHGSIVGLINQTGALQDSYTYDPYGTPLTDNGQPCCAVNVYNPWLFQGGNGYYSSSTTGLYRTGYRWNDPTLGAWTQQDILGNPFDVRGNRYIFVGDDPVNLFDPTGAESVGGSCVKGAIQGGAAGAFSGPQDAAVGAATGCGISVASHYASKVSKPLGTAVDYVGGALAGKDIVKGAVGLEKEATSLASDLGL
ncbi:MAG: DNRLRE domain-containing protein [Gaiellaceae bacterium]